MDTKEIRSTLNKECPELVFEGHPALRSKASTVDIVEGRAIGEELIKTLTNVRKIMGYGRGLAAPQIGLSKAVFVTYVDNVFEIYINPTIDSSSSTSNLYKESCLSCAGIWCDVKRPAKISIRYTDIDGVEKHEASDGFLARLLQHEYDHLLGELNIDNAVAGTIEPMTGDPLKETLRDC